MQEEAGVEGSSTAPRRLVRMDTTELEVPEGVEPRSTDPRGYAEPRPTPVQVMSAIRRPPA